MGIFMLKIRGSLNSQNDIFILTGPPGWVNEVKRQHFRLNQQHTNLHWSPHYKIKGQTNTFEHFLRYCLRKTWPYFNTCLIRWVLKYVKELQECQTCCLTHWGRLTHIRVSELPIIGSDNGLSPGRRQAIIWTNAGILLIRTLGIKFCEILSEIHTFSFTKMYLKMSSGKPRPFCLGVNVLKTVTNVFMCHYLSKFRGYTNIWNIKHDWTKPVLKSNIQTNVVNNERLRTLYVLVQNIYENHYSDTIISTMASEITGLSIVYLTVC